MKNLRAFVGTISAIVVVTAVVGFLIVYRFSHQAALARFLVDIGALIALISACVTLPKETNLKTDEVADALRDLARGRHDRRLVHKDFAQLSEIAQAFNELAGTLSDNVDLSLSRAKSARLQKPEPIVHRTLVPEQHSFHPELGSVQTVSMHHSLKELYSQFQEAYRLQGREAMDYTTFEDMVSKTRDALIKEHQVRSVRFEVVTESGEVALRPRLIR